jgi:hypothetical protein
LGGGGISRFHLKQILRLSMVIDLMKYGDNNFAIVLTITTIAFLKRI